MSFVDRTGRVDKWLKLYFNLPVMARLVWGGVFMYAVVVTGGKQYRVQEGDVIYVEKLEADVETSIELGDVLALGKEDGLVVGTPVVEGAKVFAKVLEQGKARKVIVFKYKRKKDYRRKQGHRQPFTKLQIEKIEA